MDEKLEKYPASEHGNFRIIDTIGIPHPYCIGPKHIVHASDNFGGNLSVQAIEHGERYSLLHCEMKRCNLTFSEHEKALLVESKVEELNGNEELHAYLLSIKAMTEADGYTGFAFIKAKENR